MAFSRKPEPATHRWLPPQETDQSMVKAGSSIHGRRRRVGRGSLLTLAANP